MLTLALTDTSLELMQLHAKDTPTTSACFDAYNIKIQDVDVILRDFPGIRNALSVLQAARGAPLQQRALELAPVPVRAHTPVDRASGGGENDVHPGALAVAGGGEELGTYTYVSYNTQLPVVPVSQAMI